MCGKNKSGRFWLRRKTISKRMRAKLAEVKDQLKRRRHLPIPEQGQWSAQGGARSPRLLRRARQHRRRGGLPTGSDPVPVRGAPARASAPGSLGPDAPLREAVAPTCPHPCIPSRACASTLAPKAGAQCVSSARWDLAGGRPKGRSLPQSPRLAYRCLEPHRACPTQMSKAQRVAGFTSRLGRQSGAVRAVRSRFPQTHQRVSHVDVRSRLRNEAAASPFNLSAGTRPSACEEGEHRGPSNHEMARSVCPVEVNRL